MNNKIYVSGPIGENPSDSVFKKFRDVARMLSLKGYEPVCPIDNGLIPSATHIEHMRADFPMLHGCSFIYLMKGWQQSGGCREELFYALAIGIRIVFEEEVCLSALPLDNPEEFYA